RDSQHLSDLRVAHLVLPAEDHHVAPSLGESVDSFAEGISQLGSMELVVRPQVGDGYAERNALAAGVLGNPLDHTLVFEHAQRLVATGGEEIRAHPGPRLPR